MRLNEISIMLKIADPPHNSPSPATVPIEPRASQVCSRIFSRLVAPTGKKLSR